jgi:hypothetical protein
MFHCYYHLLIVVIAIIIMSGRGRGRTGGQGRHSGRSRDSSKNSPAKATKKTLSDNVYYLGSAKQAADYETTTEFLINYIKKTFNFGNDIATALEDLEEFDVMKHKPVLFYSDSDDEDLKKAENRQYEMEFQAELEAFIKRKQMLEINMSKAYAFLWEQCSKGMQNKIEGRSDYKSDVKGNPIELLKAIKQHALNFQESRYEMSIILDALR